MKNKQAFILAAGKGSRISSISTKHPKSLLKINNKSIIKTQVDLFKDHGIKDINVVVGYKHNQIREELADDSINYIYNPFYEQMNVLGSFWFTLPYLKSDFVFVHADTIFEDKILQTLLEEAEPGINMAVDRRKCGEEEMKVKLKASSIIEVNKTMNPELADGEFIGLALIHGSIISELSESVNSIVSNNKGYNYYFESAIQEIIDNKKARAMLIDITGLNWNEIDFEKDYTYAKKLFEGNEV